MNWKVEFYDAKVFDGISDWPVHLRSKFAGIVALIKEIGPVEVGMPHIKPLGGGLFEIRVKGLEGIARALFCTKKGKIVFIISEFIKKTQKTPKAEMEVARRRMKEVKKDE